MVKKTGPTPCPVQEIVARPQLPASIPIPKKIEHEKGRFKIFRWFRITPLETAECAKDLQHFWSGPAPTYVSERYKKVLKQRGWRLEWAEKIAMGFALLACPVARTPR